MNRSYKSVWNQALGTWVATSELVSARGKRSSSKVAMTVLAIAAGVAGFAESPAAHAGSSGVLILCNAANNLGSQIGGGTAATSKISSVSSTGGNACNAPPTYQFSLDTNGGDDGTTGGDVGPARVRGYDTGILELKGSSLIKLIGQVQVGGDVTLLNKGITGLVKGAVSENSTDAVNGAELYSLSTSASTGISSLSTGVASSVQYDDATHTKVSLGASSGTPVTLTNVAAGTQPADAVNFAQLSSLSTSASTGIDSLSTGLNATNSNLTSLSTSASTGIDSLSTGLNATNSNLTSLSTSASTGIGSLSTGLNTTNSNLTSLSTSASTGIGSLSTGLNTTNSNLASLSTSASTGIGSLSTGLNTTNSNLASLSTSASTGLAQATQSINSLSTSVSPLIAASEGATSRGASLGATLAGGANPDGTSNTQGRRFDNAATQHVVAANCGTANGVDTTTTGLCASAGTIAGVNGATVTTVANGATAYGSQALSQDSNTTAVGFRSTAKYEGSVAIGYQAQAIADPATAVGSNSLASGNNSVAVGASSRATANESVALGAGSIADQAHTVSIGSAGNERRITNVAAGINPTDAVNLSQLRGVQQNVNNVSRVAYSGIAMAGALAGLPQVEPGKTLQLSAGVGNYAGYSAIALGGSARLTQNTIVKVGVSTTSGSNLLFNASAGYSW